MSSHVNPVLVGLHVLGLCLSKGSPVRGVCSRGGTPLGHELRTALPWALSSHRPPRPRSRDGDVGGAVPQRLCSYERCVHQADWGDGSPDRPRGGFAWRLEAGLQERPATWLGGGQGPAVTGGAQSASADTEGLPRLFLTPAQFREDTH